MINSFQIEENHSSFVNYFSVQLDCDVRTVRKMIKNGDFRHNGLRVTRDIPLTGGDTVELYAGDVFDGSLDIVYEDKNFVVVNKMPGIYVRCDSGKEKDLSFYVNERMKERNEYIESSGNVAYPCHLIARNTGGLVLFAKSGDMFGYVFEAIKQRRISFVYRALVCGVPEKEKFELKDYITTDDSGSARIVKKPVQGAKPALTRVSVLRSSEAVTEVELRPATVIKGQLFVQMAGGGYPILGDLAYGNAKMNRHYNVHYQACWLTDIEFFTGANNVLSYLDGVRVNTGSYIMPYISF